MNLRNNKSGFTLLEVIIVIIIVGVLASLALPRLFASVEFSRSQEALDAFSVTRKAMDNCFAISQYTSYANCATFQAIGMDDPGGAAAPFHFTYAIDNANPAGGYTITATRNAVDGTNAGDDITMTVDNAGVVTRAGTGAYLAIQ